MKRDLVIGAAISVGLHFGLLATLAYGLNKPAETRSVLEKVADVFLTENTPPPPPDEVKPEEPKPSDSGDQAPADSAPPAASIGEPPPTLALDSSLSQAIRPSLTVAPRPDSLSGGIPSGRSATAGGGSGASQAALSNVFSLGQLDRPPAERFKAAPVYPPELRRQGVSGSAEILIVLDTDGNVSEATVRRATHPSFGNAAAAAVRQWKFKPGLKDGKAVNCRLVLPVTFRLEKGS